MFSLEDLMVESAFEEHPEQVQFETVEDSFMDLFSTDDWEEKENKDILNSCMGEQIEPEVLSVDGLVFGDLDFSDDLVFSVEDLLLDPTTPFEEENTMYSSIVDDQLLEEGDEVECINVFMSLLDDDQIYQ